MSGSDNKTKRPPKTTTTVDGGAAVMVSTLPEVARFCRAGLCFYTAPTTLVIADLDDGVLEALQAEPHLVVIMLVTPEEAPAA